MSDELSAEYERLWEGLTPPYRTIVADPPWRVGVASGTSKATPQRGLYSTMATPEICAMPVAMLAAEDAHLWLWGINAMMEDAFQVVRAWGFQPKTILTWCKPGPGVGGYLRNNTEHAILATRGRRVTPTEKPLSSWFVWSRSHHSAKPDGFGDIVEQVSPGPYVELFCRRPRMGWDSWGYGYEVAS